MATAKTVKKKTTVEADETPQAFAVDMAATMRKHWKFFLGFVVGAMAMYMLL